MKERKALINREMIFIHIRTNLKNSLGSIQIDRNASQHLLPVEGILIPFIDFSYVHRAAPVFGSGFCFEKKDAPKWKVSRNYLRTSINGSTSIITQNFSTPAQKRHLIVSRYREGFC